MQKWKWRLTLPVNLPDGRAGSAAAAWEGGSTEEAGGGPGGPERTDEEAQSAHCSGDASDSTVCVLQLLWITFYTLKIKSVSVWFSPPVISLRSESFRLNWRRWRSRDTLCRKRWDNQNMKCFWIRCLNSPPRHRTAGGARSHSPLLLFVSLNVFFWLSSLSPPHRRAAPAECVQGAVPGVVHCGA